MLPFVLIFLVAGLGLVLVGRHLSRRTSEAATWPTVEGVLEQCEVVEVPGIGVEDTSSWQLRICYSYVVRGRTYRSTQYAFGYGDGRSDEKHRAVAQALRAQTPLLVHYDPKHPAEAVLSTQQQPNISTLGYFMLGLTVVATLIWLAGG